MKNKLVVTLLVLGTFIFGIIVGKSPYSSFRYYKSLIEEDSKIESKSYFGSFYMHKASLYERLKENNSYKIAMLGDSITDWAEWNELLERDDVINRGISGDSTDGILRRIDGINSSVKKVFILIGVNDLGKGKSVDYIFDNYKKIIEAIKQKNMQPIIQSILFVDSDKIQYIKNSDIELLNNKLKTYAKENELVFIDLNGKLSKDKRLRSDYTYDGLHLNGNAYHVWKKIIISYFDYANH